MFETTQIGILKATGGFGCGMPRLILVETWSPLFSVSYSISDVALDTISVLNAKVLIENPFVYFSKMCDEAITKQGTMLQSLKRSSAPGTSRSPVLVRND